MNNRVLVPFLKEVKSRPMVGIAVISAFYFFGIIGIISDYKDWFVEKTAFNLTLSLLILIVYQEKYTWSLFWAFLFCYVVGFSAEYLGVNFGMIFGEYMYPDTLGPQVAGVPIIIGVNWFLITFCVAALIFPLKLNIVLKILIATFATVMVDVLIEPVAMELFFWNWPNDLVPFQNYLGWAMISFLIFIFYSIVKIPLKNRIALPLLMWQLIFFAALNLFLID